MNGYADSYDGDSRLTGLAYTSDGGANTIDTFGWTYDGENNVTSFNSNNGTATYAYDPTNQLTSASYTIASGGHQPANESYSFTANGNRDSSGDTTGSDNLMSSDGTYNYTHDAVGNTISRTQIASTYSAQYLTTYTWDYRNRLTDVENYDNNDVLTSHVHYVYDVFDHLIATEVDTTGDGTYNEIDHWVLDVSPEIPQAGVPGTALAQPVFEFNGNQDLTIRYLEVVDRIFAEEAVTSPAQAGTNTWDLVNNLGSVVYVLDNTGAVVDQLVYNAFGVVAYESSASVDHFAGFAGGHIDQSAGLVIFYHRPYDPADGRWLTTDPDGFTAGDADLSRYAGNNPTSRIDPLGLAAPTVQDLQAQLRAAQVDMSEAQVEIETAMSDKSFEKSSRQMDMNDLYRIVPRNRITIEGVEDYIIVGVDVRGLFLNSAERSNVTTLRRRIASSNDQIRRDNNAISAQGRRIQADTAKIARLTAQLNQLLNPGNKKPN